MGDIVRTQDREVTFKIDAHASAAIERIEIRNGLETLETYRPYTEDDLGRPHSDHLGRLRVSRPWP